MSAQENDTYFDCSFVSIHYIICECGETFPSENGLRAHLEKEHPHKRERKEFKCGVCGCIYPSEDECITHYEENHIITDIKTEPEEIEEVEETVEITEDEKPDPNMIMAKLGPSEEHQILNIPEEFGQMVQIAEDGQLIFYVNADQESVEVSEYVPAKKKGGQMGQAKKKTVKHIVCEVCGKSYASKAALKYHQRVHTGERPYSCHLCPKSFAMPLFLQIHVRTHTGERPFQCPLCPKAFSNKAALLRHDRVHTGEKPYECPMCLKSFTQSNSMKLHVATVHLKQPAPYKSKTRKLKAQERLLAKLKKEPVDSEVTAEIQENVENEDGQAFNVIGKEVEENIYEVIESEVISDSEKEVYEIVYK